MVQLLLSLFPLATPLPLLIAAVCSGGAGRWDVARRATTASLLLAAAAAALAFGPAGLVGMAGVVSTAPASLVLALLISFIAFVLVRFSRNYLSGEPGESRYLAMLMLTPAAVTVVVLTDHLLVLLAGWTAISLTLHQLLVFYPDRPRAALAAHKKFLFARLAELCLLAAVLLLHGHHDTWVVSRILAAYPVAELSLAEQCAALLLACAALIKCAQLPMHGWLIQVVEAPTPVSALLHGGIINLGGYLLILFAPLFVQATAAQWLVLVVAGLTAVLATLVMTTRISIKVKLAWSTSAQMGLMLVECALGLFQLALLHLLAHACYKAYAFLESGSAVEKHVARQLAPAAALPLRDWVTGIVVALTATAAVGLSVAAGGPIAPWLLIASALAVLIAQRSSSSWRGSLVAAMGAALLMLIAYAGQKWLASLLAPEMAASAGAAADVWVCTLILMLGAVWWLVRARPQLPLVQRLVVWLYAGFYLDEWTTRTTLRIWPIRLPVRANPKRLPLVSEEITQ